jgi:hypothetical protein
LQGNVEMAQEPKASGEPETEPKSVEESLGHISARYEAILAAVPDIIMEVNAEKVYTWGSSPNQLSHSGPLHRQARGNCL